MSTTVLTGADDPHSALILQQQLADLFTRGAFLLRKWNSSDPSVLEKIPQELRDTNRTQTISEVNEYTKTLGIEWNISTDGFRLTIAEFSPDTTITKRRMVSDVAKVFDVMGWFSPAIIKMKILLQTSMGNKTRLGRSDPRKHLSRLVPMEKRATFIDDGPNSSMLLAFKGNHRINSIAWIQRRLGRSLRWCRLPAH
jgi:hypothetical protein